MRRFIKNNYLGLLIGLIYIGLYVYSPTIFPDLLKLHRIDPSNYFELLISSTTSIFGILVAVILLTFEFGKQDSFRKKEANIFTKPIVTIFVSLAISVIILSLISYVNIQNFNQSNTLTIGYFLGFLFAVFIGLIFPAIKTILETANTLKFTIKEIQNLSIEDFENLLIIQDRKLILKDRKLAIIRVRQELVNTVRECDYEAYTTILVAINNQTIKLIKKGKDRNICDTVLRGVTFIWNEGSLEALRVGNNQYFETIWACNKELYEYAAIEKIYLLHYQPLHFFQWDFIKFLARNKLGDALSSGAKTLTIILKQNLKLNCPPQEEISDLYDIYKDKNPVSHNSESSLQWDSILEFVFLINDIQNLSIENNDKVLYDTCRFEFEYFLREIDYSYKNIGLYQEAYIIGSIISHLTNNAQNAFEASLFNQTSHTFDIDTSFISDLIKNEKFYVKRILQNISDLIIISQRKEKLDDYFTLNSWGALGRHISEPYFTNETAKEALHFILDTLDTLKHEIEKNQLPFQARNYNEIKDQFVSIRRWLCKYDGKEENIIFKRIDCSLKKFKTVKGVTDFSIVKWTDSKKD
jgi:hypothetical protein